MPEARLLVGRDGELARFRQVLEEDAGRAVLIVGQEGMGKTSLATEMAERAAADPVLKCSTVRYEVIRQQSVEALMEQMLQEAHAATGSKSSLDGTGPRIRQFQALLKLLPKGGQIVDLLTTLREDVQRPAWARFADALRAISARLPAERRALFVIDPLTYLEEGSDEAWVQVLGQLPERIKFLFPQRPTDALAKSRKLAALPQVLRIPDSQLEALDASAVDRYVSFCDLGEHRAGFERYAGHPYAMAAAADLLLDGLPAEELPDDPSGIAEAQWRRVCRYHPKAIPLFEAHAVLEIAVPERLAAQVAEIKPRDQKHLLGHRFLAGLLPVEDGLRRIYHDLLRHEILQGLDEDDATALHERAIEYYEAQLEGERPDPVAARRLPEHVLAARGEAAFVKAVAYQSMAPLRVQGLLEEALDLLHLGLEVSRERSSDRAALLSSFGLIHLTRGDLARAESLLHEALELNEELGIKERVADDYSSLSVVFGIRGDLGEAESLHRRSLALNEELGRKEGLAHNYGNLGLIYQSRGDLDEAESLHRQSLALHEELGRKEGMARNYGNLGLIYRTRGDLDEAESLHRWALALNEELGRKEGMAFNYGNLGVIYGIRGDLGEAESLHHQSLALHEELGRKEGMARDNQNLGVIYRARGDSMEARGHWERALDLFLEVGMKPAVDRVRGLLAGLEGDEDDGSSDS